jgi:hypothetical protein
MKKILFSICLFATMCNRYPDNRNKDRNPDAQMESDTVVHPYAQRDSADITDPHLERSQHDSPAGGTAR